jgi:HD-like signal output (HDOD) protein
MSQTQTGARSLLDVLEAELARQDLQLPVYPGIAARVQSLAASGQATADQFERLLGHDPAMASHVLRVANSAFYAGLSSVATIRAAVLRLGLDQLVSIAVVCAQKGQFAARDPQLQRLMSQLWQHSVAVAFGSRWLAERVGYKTQAGECFMAGLFHDIGKLLILKVLDDLRRRGEYQHELPESLVQELLSQLHGEQGSRLIRQWNLSPLYAEIARTHNLTIIDDSSPIHLIVRLVNTACTKLGLNLYRQDGLVLAASAEASGLGLKEVLIAELEIMLEDGVQTLAI